MVSSTQSNTREGDFPVVGSESLVDLEGHLVLLVNDSGTLKCRLPNDVAEKTAHVVVEGAAAGAKSTLRPLSRDRNFRVKIKGTCVPGDLLANVVDGSEDGRVQKLPEAADTYWVPLVALETAADNQLVLCAPLFPDTVVVTE